MKPEPCPTAPQTLRPGADFLQFAVAFAQMDLAHLRAGDWTNLREDFERYMGQVSLIGGSGNCIRAYPTEAVVPTAVPLPMPAAFEPRHFQALQQVTRPLLQDEASEKTIPLGTMHPVAETVYIHGLARSTPGRRQLLVSGDTQSCFVKVLRWLLEQEPPGRVLACPECGKLFYRHKLQAYCTRQCGNRQTVRNFRARHGRTPASPVA